MRELSVERWGLRKGDPSTPQPSTLNSQPPSHTPAMLQEVLELLDPQPGGLYMDATVGLGGHASAVLARLAPRGRLLGLDQDPEALALARERLEQVARQHEWTVSEPFQLARANFSAAGALLDRLGVEDLRGALFDLGVSSLQLDRPERGFSFRSDGPLDMRMDPGQPRTAAELVNTLPESELARVIADYGEERWARRVARAIVTARGQRPIGTTAQLSQVVSRAVPRSPGLNIHPATRTFQALRIALNGELDVLAGALEACVRRLAPGGRIVVLAYHSLEDRIVKRTFARLSGRCECPPRLPVCNCGAEPLLKVLTRKPLTPGDEEVDSNPRARSARLRAAERTADNR